MAIDIFCYVSYNVFVCVFGKCLKWKEKLWRNIIMQKFSVKTIVAIGIGAALFFFGKKSGKKRPLVVGIIMAILGVLAVITNLGAIYPWLTVGIPAIPSLYFDWFGGCIQAFIFCTLTTLFIKQAAGD